MIQRIAEHYLSGPNLVGLDFRAISERVHRDFAALPWKVEFTSVDPYIGHYGQSCPDVTAVTAEVRATGRLYIWVGGEAPIGLDEHINWRARAVHDSHHLHLSAGFDLPGERAVARYSSNLTPALASWYASEILGQAAVALTTGQFPEQRLVAGLEKYL